MKRIFTTAVVLTAILLFQKPAPAQADETNKIHQTLLLISSLVGSVGSGPSPTTLIMELSGMSFADCTLTFTGIDMSGLTCQQFLDLLSTCNSLTGKAKSVLKATKKKYIKSYPKRVSKPCLQPH